ncbi:hypothetical protein JTE90_004361 [Oedothorax gibbosus]|uniref:Protein kinase domain-containing protein n=1 Tax=Oedothorax gibbosus TaxID=931172 RepID=A0AAV6VJX2_9ARAC|nr:hypothetical protein JTE90_004361 [Oedothorax gibbosus]
MEEVRLTCGGSFANFVLEYCNYELAKLIARQSLRFHLAEIKAILKQLFEGLSYLHEQSFIHRDIKPANVLINNAGELKIADFGLARQFPPPADERTIYSPRVVTLWYRAPEILLGQKDYGTSVDLWAAGCLAAEMWTRTPILQGKGEPDQLNQIIKLCGPITMDTFPGVVKIALFHKVRLPRHKRRLQETLRSTVTDRHGLDLIDKLLTIDTETRADAKAVLDHEFFKEEPLDCDLRELLAQFERKRR